MGRFISGGYNPSSKEFRRKSINLNSSKTPRKNVPYSPNRKTAVLQAISNGASRTEACKNAGIRCVRNIARYVTCYAVPTVLIHVHALTVKDVLD